ncbi:type VI secretion system amidase effector protein Tae4 [Paraburkholderia sp. J63]|uniref:type VI secretion system amidase effector protein Tae4 n=1 Tax=Paraburkholderia sp. J63 TaxID=2805434 RepID=UPI002ABDB55B|nr:type VI secretion system amidase effector protein Tae4 [Paraburkholderia sp. J63]
MSVLAQRVRVKTNATKGSVCKIHVRATTFADLWGNYVTGDPYRDEAGKVPPGYSNQCAIRMSATFHKIGIEMKSFTPANVTIKSGDQFGRILLDGKFTATRADQLGSWLSKQPFCGLPQKPEDVTGSDWESRIRGRTGIVMFDSYWARHGESAATSSGGHIDLWNGSRLTISGALDLLSVIGRRLGISSARIPGTSMGYSDLSRSKTILFWEVM